MYRVVDGGVQRHVSTLDYYAGEPAEHHLHVAQLVDTTARPVHVGHTNADALDRCRELPELHAQLASNMGLLVVIEIDPDEAHVGRRPQGVLTTALSLLRSWNPGSEWYCCRGIGLEIQNETAGFQNESRGGFRATVRVWSPEASSVRQRVTSSVAPTVPTESPGAPSNRCLVSREP